MIEWVHSFLNASLRKLICYHNTDWDEIAHMVMNAYNVFPYLSAGEVPFYLMFECITFIPTLFKLLLPKLKIYG